MPKSKSVGWFSQRSLGPFARVAKAIPPEELERHVLVQAERNRRPNSSRSQKSAKRINPLAPFTQSEHSKIMLSYQKRGLFLIHTTRNYLVLFFGDDRVPPNLTDEQIVTCVMLYPAIAESKDMIMLVLGLPGLEKIPHVNVYDRNGNITDKSFENGIAEYFQAIHRIYMDAFKLNKARSVAMMKGRSIR